MTSFRVQVRQLKGTLNKIIEIFIFLFLDMVVVALASSNDVKTSTVPWSITSFSLASILITFRFLEQTGRLLPKLGPFVDAFTNS